MGGRDVCLMAGLSWLVLVAMVSFVHCACVVRDAVHEQAVVRWLAFGRR